MTKDAIIDLYPAKDYHFVATCTCGSNTWYLVTDKLGSDWESIIGTRCADPDCDVFVNWTVVKKKK